MNIRRKTCHSKSGLIFSLSITVTIYFDEDINKVLCYFSNKIAKLFRGSAEVLKKINYKLGLLANHTK
jgi:hypothetical protein